MESVRLGKIGTELGFIALIFSLAASPSISALVGLKHHDMPLYLSDVVTFTLLVIFTIKIYIKKGKLKSSFLDIGFFIYLSVAAISSIKGILCGTIEKPIISMLYFLKQVEYVLIFYLVFNHIETREQIKRYLTAWFLASGALAVYGIYEHFYPIVYMPGFNRVYERGLYWGEANHFAGYFVLFICISAAVSAYKKRITAKIAYAALCGVMSTALLWTYSRQAYIAVAGALLTLFWLKSKRALAIFFLCLLLIPSILPGKILERSKSLGQEIYIDNLNQSTVASRLYSWSVGFSSVPQYPFFGVGLGARHRGIYDNHFVLVLSEMGFIGLVSFCYLIFLIIRKGITLFRRQNDPMLKALALGVTAGFIGITLQGMASVSFIIMRIAAPLFFMVGMLCASENLTDQS
jgi:O-antigen ligase